jgi:hypothetical protein
LHPTDWLRVANSPSKGVHMICFRHAERVGHFAMWENAALSAVELPAAFRSLRGARS